MENRFLNLVEKSIKQYWGTPVFSDYEGDTFLYQDMAKEIEKLHLLFREAGVFKGDRIAITGRNCARWGISFFAALSYGAVAVPILHDFTAESIHHLVNHCEAKILIAAQYNLNFLSKEKMQNVQLLMLLEDLSIVEGSENVKRVYENLENTFLQRYAGFNPENIKYHEEDPEELAIINYTSGTTGFSKGVMIPYRSLWSNTQYAYDNLSFVHEGDNLVSILPMAHMYGLAFEILNGIGKGCHIHFLPRVPSPQIVLEAFKKIRPTLIITVPLIIEKIVQNRIFPLLKKPMMKFLRSLPGIKSLINRKIQKQLNAAFGGEFEEIIIGGAAFSPEVETFLKSIKFRYTVGYGMTECGPLIAYKQWDEYKQGSVGSVVDRMAIKIDSDNSDEIGEILVRGMNTMLGYYKNPDATKEAFTKDGWLRTGDLGTIDEGGNLFIRGRSKTMILSSNGQNIYPEELEGILNNMPYVSESLVISRQEKETSKHVLVALVHPLWEQAKEEGLDREPLMKIINENISVLNKQMPYYSQIAGVELQEEEFEKTPKRNIRRFLYQNKESG